MGTDLEMWKAWQLGGTTSSLKPWEYKRSVAAGLELAARTTCGKAAGPC